MQANIDDMRTRQRRHPVEDNATATFLLLALLVIVTTAATCLVVTLVMRSLAHY